MVAHSLALYNNSSKLTNTNLHVIKYCNRKLLKYYSKNNAVSYKVHLKLKVKV